MNCPKCESKFEQVSVGEIKVERCLGCQGLWFAMLGREDLVKIEGSETIDIGNQQVGAEYTNMRDIKCPQCSVEMIPMVDREKDHINYESCPSCHGTFFDAGEFRDLKENSVLDRFTTMLKTLRANL